MEQKMTGQDHILAWIESSGPHYKRLLEIYRRRQPGCSDGFISQAGLAAAALNLVYDAYTEMLRGGDASREDKYSAAERLRAALLIVEWESPK
jgi:hypothetical protein